MLFHVTSCYHITQIMKYLKIMVNIPGSIFPLTKKHVAANHLLDLSMLTYVWG